MRVNIWKTTIGNHSANSINCLLIRTHNGGFVVCF